MSKYIIGILSIALIGGYIYFNSRVADLEFENAKIDKERKEQLQHVRDSLHASIDTLTTKYQKRFDSIANAPLQIKYIPYEKPIYINRSVDNAISIITDYTYETTKKDTMR